MPKVEALRFSSNHLWFGGDYNPDQWSDLELDADLALFERAHVNTVTVGVFSWSSLEPAEGEYRFDWLDRALDRLHAAGVGVILATPTASPPPWFSRLHPEALPVTTDGVRLIHGSRDTYNPAAPAYREAARRITRVLAGRYGNHPALVMWHLHNEYGTVSYGPVSDAEFRIWLRRKYHDLDTLNSAWNTTFWSQIYSDWRDIHAPQKTQYLPNPAQALDYKRFSADILRDCLRDQVDIVRELTPKIPTTTNFMLPTWNHYDQWDFAREVDVVSIDHYLDNAGPSGDDHVAFAADLARSFAGGHPWLLMEQATSLIYDYAGGKMLVKEPGRIRRNTYQYLARGAFGSLFFQWRSPVVGAEFFHSAMLPHSGAQTRIFREIASLGAELARVREAVADPLGGDPVVAARVAIVWSSDAWWAAETPMMPSGDIGFLDEVRRAYACLRELNVAVDFVSPDGDLARYDVLLVPSLIPVSDAQAEQFRAFVADGGCLVAWFFAGTTDENLHVRPGGYSATFAELAGVWIEEHVPLPEGEHVVLSDGSNGSDWTEHVHLIDAEAWITYPDGVRVGVIPAGAPAVTRRETASGAEVYYLSTRLSPDALRSLMTRVLHGAGVPTSDYDGVEKVWRRAGDGNYLFVINHRAEPARVVASGTELIANQEIRESFIVGAGDVAVVREHQ